MYYYAKADGWNYDDAVKIIDLNTCETSEHRIPITANTSTEMKNTGTKLSFKIEESIRTSVPDIEQIELLYYPGVVH
jgi:hypothetical protein